MKRLLSATRARDARVVSVWEPTEAERQLLAAGGSLLIGRAGETEHTLELVVLGRDADHEDAASAWVKR